MKEKALKLFFWAVLMPIAFFIIFPIFAAAIAIIAKFIGVWWIDHIGAWWHYWLTI